MFIVFEGLDGSGKTTQIHHLSSHLKSKQVDHEVLAEPGTTEFGMKVRQVVLHEKLDITPRAELMLYEAARAQLTDEYIHPLLTQGKTVISDRYSLSSIAYQGYGRQLELDKVRQVDGWATNGLIPDITLFIDIPIEEIAKRQSGYRDRLEQENLDFFRRVRDGYLAELASLTGAHILNGLQHPKPLFEQIQSIVDSHLDAA
jgi:dTMP kinase